MQAFAENPWFAGLPKDDADALLAAATPIHLAQGAFAFQQGDRVSDKGGAFFGVARGRLKMQLLHPDGKEAILAVIEPGNWVGEVSILDQLPPAHTAVALVETELLAVNAKTFLTLMQRSAFANAVARLLAGRLRLAYGIMGDSALYGIRERVARRLLMLAHGDVTLSAGVRTQLSISQDIVAMLLGISRPTLNKELQALAKLGAIHVRYGRIEICDMALLHECCRKGSGEWEGFP